MAEQHVQRVHTQDVVLDIGGDVGALILYTTPEFAGTEIEVSPAGDESRRTHTDVHERRFAGRTLFTAIYPALAAGEYTIWNLDGQPSGRVTITGGQVTELHWPAG
jgi:hypothetical protein